MTPQRLRLERATAALQLGDNAALHSLVTALVTGARLVKNFIGIVGRIYAVQTKQLPVTVLMSLDANLKSESNQTVTSTVPPQKHQMWCGA